MHIRLMPVIGGCFVGVDRPESAYVLALWKVWRWEGLAKIVWGKAHERNVKIDRFCRHKSLFKEELIVLALGDRKNLSSFTDAVDAALA